MNNEQQTTEAGEPELEHDKDGNPIINEDNEN